MDDQLIELPSLAVRAGINHLFSSYANLSVSDAVVVGFQNNAQTSIAAAWLLSELEERGNTAQFVRFSYLDEESIIINKFNQVLDDFQNKHNRIVIFVLETEKLSFSSFFKRLNASPQIDVLRMMNTSAHLFEQGFTVSKTDLQHINAGLLSRLRQKEIVHLQVENINAGQETDLAVVLNNAKYSWTSVYGESRAGELTILPGSEINTYPEDIHGLFVAFGAIHSNVKLPFDTRLVDKPVYLDIEHGILKKFWCKDTQLKGFLDEVFKEPHLTTVAEFGIGTNRGLTQFTANNSHINERFPGVHLGFGKHLQQNKVEYYTPIHIDFISPYGLIKIDGESDVICLDRLEPVQVQHPDDTTTEDGD